MRRKRDRSWCGHLVPFWSEQFRRSKRVFVFCFQFRMSKGGWTAFRMGVGHGWKERSFPLLLQRCASIFSSHRRSSTGHHVAYVSNLNKIKTVRPTRADRLSGLGRWTLIEDACIETVLDPATKNQIVCMTILANTARMRHQANTSVGKEAKRLHRVERVPPSRRTHTYTTR